MSSALHIVSRSWTSVLLAISTIGFSAGYASADPGSLSAPLCGVLKGVGPKTRGYEPEGARAQLVLSIAAAFDYDAAKLKEVRAHIDEATAKSCPKDRELMLGNTKTKTLGEAIE
jgi:hypothetical protein